MRAFECIERAPCERGFLTEQIVGFVVCFLFFFFKVFCTCVAKEELIVCVQTLSAIDRISFPACLGGAREGGREAISVIRDSWRRPAESLQNNLRSTSAGISSQAVSSDPAWPTRAAKEETVLGSQPSAEIGHLQWVWDGRCGAGRTRGLSLRLPNSM